MIQPSLSHALMQLGADLRAIGVRWCLVGGLAVSARAEPRTTRDLDVVVAISDDGEAEKVVSLLTQRGYRIAQVLEHRDRDRLATARLWMPGRHGDLLADLIFAATGIEPEIAARAELLAILPGLFVPLATVADLLAMKVLALRKENPAVRPQDFTDVRELLTMATDEDLAQARSALDAITRRGFDRGRDLLGDLDDQIRQFRERRDV